MRSRRASGNALAGVRNRKILEVYIPRNAIARHADACRCNAGIVHRRGRGARCSAGVAAVSQSNDNDRGGRQPVARAKNTTPNDEEELVNAPAGQKLFRPLLS